MKISIHLPEEPTDDEVKKAIAMIGMYVGNERMIAIAGSMAPMGIRQGEGPGLPGALAGDVPVPPPVPMMPVVPPVPASQLSGLSALPATSFTTAQGVTVELDSTGLPWDARIHSGSKNKTQKGAWKAKKNVEAGAITAVEMELRNAIAARTFQPVGQTPTPVAPPAPPALPTAAPVPPPVLTPQAAGGGTVVSTFAELMQKVAPMLAAKTITNDRLNEIAAQCGAGSFPMLATRNDLVPAFDAMLTMSVPA